MVLPVRVLPSNLFHFVQNLPALRTGACGKKVSDSSRVVALSAGTYRQNCYKTVTITNLKTGKTIEASVNDEVGFLILVQIRN